MDIKTLQTNLPWGAHDYNEAFQARTDPQRDTQHALLHITKAAGKLADIVDWFDHTELVLSHGTGHRDAAGKYLADLVICAMRIANTWPGGAIDLDAAINRRLTQKFLTKCLVHGHDGSLLPCSLCTEAARNREARDAAR